MPLYIKGFIQFIKESFKLLLCVGVFCVLVVVFVNFITWYVTQSYEPMDIPNKRFMVLVQDDNGSTKPVSYDVASQAPLSIVTDTQANAEQEDFLNIRDDGYLVYHNGGALWYSQSVYSVEGATVVPISFRFVTLVHFVVAIILAAITFAFGKYLVTRWLLRGCADSVYQYNQRIFKNIKNCLISVAVLVLLYAIFSF